MTLWLSKEETNLKMKIMINKNIPLSLDKAKFSKINIINSFIYRRHYRKQILKKLLANLLLPADF